MDRLHGGIEASGSVGGWEDEDRLPPEETYTDADGNVVPPELRCACPPDEHTCGDVAPEASVAVVLAQHLYRLDADGEYECPCGADVAGVAQVVHQAAMLAKPGWPNAADHVERTFTRERAREIGFGDPYDLIAEIVAELRRPK